jgi:CheY-like chemotaxis protein
MENKQHTILCVDDEINVLKALQRVLRKEGYRLLTANSSAEAMEVLSKEDVCVIICDQRMPETNGVELLKRVSEIYPDIVRITLTGFTDVDTIRESVNKGHIYKILLKPWNDENLILELRQSVKQYELAMANRELTQKIALQNEELKRFNDHLENLVMERTEEIVIRHKALELAQAILSDLPVPIVGLDKEGMVAMTNRALDDMFEGIVAFQVGRLIEEFFPENISQHIRNLLCGKTDNTDNLFSMGGVDFQVKHVPLSGRFKGRGMVLSFIKK